MSCRRIVPAPPCTTSMNGGRWGTLAAGASDSRPAASSQCFTPPPSLVPRPLHGVSLEADQGQGAARCREGGEGGSHGLIRWGVAVSLSPECAGSKGRCKFQTERIKEADGGRYVR